MRDYEARDLASTINGDYPDWEAEVEPDGRGFATVVATFEEGGVHRQYSPSDWEEVKALVYGDEDEE